MNEEKLYDAITNIDEDLLDRSLNREKSSLGKNIWAVGCAVGIVLCVMLIVFPIIKQNNIHTKEKVYEIKTDGYGDSPFNHTNEITDSNETVVIDEKVGLNKTIEFAGKTYETVYDFTGRFTGKVFDCFSFEDSEGEEKRFLLKSDGTIAGVMFKFMKIEVDPFEESDSVFEKAKAVLKDYADFDLFDEEKLSVWSSFPDMKYGFGNYFFDLYEYIGDVKTTNYLHFYVTEQGEIGALKLSYILGTTYEGYSDNFTSSDYLPYVEKKLNEIYSSAMDYYEVEDCMLGKLNNEDFLYFTVLVYYKNEKGETDCERCKIAVSTDIDDIKLKYSEMKTYS